MRSMRRDEILPTGAAEVESRIFGSGILLERRSITSGGPFEIRGASWHNWLYSGVHSGVSTGCRCGGCGALE